ncbi:MAG: DeoR/GlpR family transcriptional regulator [Microlunatus sp.]|nr:DeoR/GlpR family transcriptional regulator [Microlunatus sp.]
MLAAERRERILTAARRDGVVRVADLVEELRFSRMTIRRDLEVLSEQGLLHKVRGGAMLQTPRAAAPIIERDARDQVVVGVLTPSAHYFRHIVDGARRVTSQSGGTVRLVTSGYDPQAEERLVRELVESGASGLLLAPSFSAGESPEYLRHPAVPTVLIEREPPPTDLATLSTVRSAHERGVAAALAHLRDLGHRRIALISRVFSQTGSFVQRGYRQAVTALELAGDVPAIIGTDPGTVRPGLTPEGPEIIFEQLVGAAVTAVLCHGDEDALVLSQYAQAHGRSVPADLSIVSYNDEVAGLGDPPLTAVAPPKEQIGTIAAQLLFSLLEPDADQTPIHIQIDPRLIIRSSTAVNAGAARS